MNERIQEARLELNERANLLRRAVAQGANTKILLQLGLRLIAAERALLNAGTIDTSCQVVQ